MNERKTPKTKNGAKGISLFIPYFFEKSKRNIPTIAPDQKAKTPAESNIPYPKSHPKLRESFASPKPIQVPLEISQIKAKGNAKNIPDKNCNKDGICGEKAKSSNRNKPMKVITPKKIEKISGIILCL